MIEHASYRSPTRSPLATVSKYDYTNDTLGRRVTVENLGSAFGTLVYGNDYVYNDRSELTESHRYDDLYGEIPTARRLYDYDNIGNRETDTDGDATPPGTRYATNALNQYTMTRGFVESFVHDADGNMTKSGLAAGDFNADGDIDLADFGVFQDCFNGPNRPPKPACTTLATDIDGDGDVDMADYTLFQACYNGSNRPPKCNAGVRPTQYTWDAENRLVEVQPIIPQEGEKKATFAYDYMGRRVQKQVYNRSGSSWVLESDVRFVYDQWNVVMVVDDEGEPQKKHTWGLDLSGLGRVGQPPSAVSDIHGAAGIGGLLAVEETVTEGSPKYWFFYDGNGNVGQMLQYTPGSPPTVALAGRYEYDPYGNVIGPDEDADGQWTDDATAYALANPFRFSTKPFDAATGLYYYGWRYLGPLWGRWTSHDPIEEEGGLNLYTFVGNGPPGAWDAIGLDMTEAACYAVSTPARARCLQLKILKRGCKAPKVVCKCCNPNEGGGFASRANVIELCTNGLSTPGGVQRVLDHEYQHAWQFCKNPKFIDGGNECACAEIQAAYCSGQCDTPGNGWRRANETKDGCVQRLATFSTINGCGYNNGHLLVKANYAKPICKDCTECP